MGEATRWYNRAGKPVNEIQGKNGNLRATTLRDARKMELVPSVTSIMQIKATPALDAWKTNQILEAAIELPAADRRAIEFDEDAWKKAVKEKAGQVAADARDDGKRIHGYLEDFFRHRPTPPEARPYTDGVRDLIVEECGMKEWKTESSFSHPYGFGGSADIHNNDFLLDFKTRDFSPSDPDPKGYDNHVMQLAAYRTGLELNDVRCANVFVSRTAPGYCTIYWWSEEEIQRGWKMFHHCLQLWKIDRKYEVGIW